MVERKRKKIVFFGILVLLAAFSGYLPIGVPGPGAAFASENTGKNQGKYTFTLSPEKPGTPGEYTRKEIESFLCAFVPGYIGREDLYKIPHTGKYAVKAKSLVENQRILAESQEISRWFEDQVTVTARGNFTVLDIETITAFYDKINQVIGKKKFVYTPGLELANIIIELAPPAQTFSADPYGGETSVLKDNLRVRLTSHEETLQLKMEVYTLEADTVITDALHITLSPREKEFRKTNRLVKIYLRNILDPQVRYFTFVHEFMHSLGFPAHSPYPESHLFPLPVPAFTDGFPKSGEKADFDFNSDGRPGSESQSSRGGGSRPLFTDDSQKSAKETTTFATSGKNSGNPRRTDKCAERWPDRAFLGRGSRPLSPLGERMVEMLYRTEILPGMTLKEAGEILSGLKSVQSTSGDQVKTFLVERKNRLEDQKKTILEEERKKYEAKMKKYIDLDRLINKEQRLMEELEEIRTDYGQEAGVVKEIREKTTAMARSVRLKQEQTLVEYREKKGLEKLPTLKDPKEIKAVKLELKRLEEEIVVLKEWTGVEKEMSTLEQEVMADVSSPGKARVEDQLRRIQRQLYTIEKELGAIFPLAIGN